jgi:hypothetical protein
LAEDSNPQIRPKLETILYGASYYHEYMPFERLVQDIALMKRIWRAGSVSRRVGASRYQIADRNRLWLSE